MSTLPSSKYNLKTLHEEIDLFDRKLAHLLKYEPFATDAERDTAAGKISAKRDLLVRKAQHMVDEGIEFQESERPKSLRPETTADSAPALASEPKQSVVAIAEPSEPPSSPYAGTALDCQPDLDAYKKARARRKTA